MPAQVTVRMYDQQNLGDCFLLEFKDQGKLSYILIDFGSYETGNQERELEMANSIKSIVQDEPIIIVLTHQHKDHLSGFITAKEAIDTLNVADVWFSYLDDPKSKEGKAMREAMKKLLKTNDKIKEKTRVKFGEVESVKKMLKAKDAIDLFAEDQTGGQAYTNLIGLCKKTPQFLLPGQSFDLPRLPKNSVRVYVMGPPTDEKLLRKMNPSGDEAVHSLNAVSGMMNLETSSSLMLNALNAISPGEDSYETANFPFNKTFSFPLNDATKKLPVRDSYSAETWRRIDHEWLSEMGRMSLHLGNLTNNSSLVLAFELVEQEKVLLFVADAQIGNWKSWLDLSFNGSSVDAKDLLTRTVFYKAGHHSSHNATLAEGLDLMNEKELVIMIPINEEVSTKMNFAMLQQGMLKGYNRKSEGRVLRADTIFHKPKSASAFKFPFASSEKDFSPKVKIVKDKSKESHLYIEYVVK